MAKVLIVDDEPRLRNLLALALHRDGHCVSLHASGVTGLAAAESGGYDLVVLDLMLPGLDGFEVLTQLLPRYVATRLFQAVLETTASEQSSRMVAMRNATDNAQELIEDLTLTYNKVRQANITREMIEIATGAATA